LQDSVSEYNWHIQTAPVLHLCFPAEKAHLSMLTADSGNAYIESTGIHVMQQKD